MLAGLSESRVGVGSVSAAMFIQEKAALLYLYCSAVQPSAEASSIEELALSCLAAQDPGLSYAQHRPTHDALFAVLKLVALEEEWQTVVRLRALLGRLMCTSFTLNMRTKP